MHESRVFSKRFWKISEKRDGLNFERAYFWMKFQDENLGVW